MPFPFEKMHGIGNDFVVIRAEEWGFARWDRAAQQLCNRHFGIGADGLLVLDHSDRANYRMRMFNPDGTEDDCGNGLRCMVRYVHCHLNSERRLTFETISGLHQAEILHHAEHQSLVRVSMGAPRFRPAEIPMLAAGDQIVDYPLSYSGRLRRFTCINTGSTHAVTFLERPVDDAVFHAESHLIEHHPLFPDRTSVIWVVPISPGAVQIRIWERGAGETLGCGTGACAAAVAFRVQNPGAGPITVTSPGGSLQIEWQPGSAIQMTGPAATVFRGTWPGE